MSETGNNFTTHFLKCFKMGRKSKKFFPLTGTNRGNHLCVFYAHRKHFPILTSTYLLYLSIKQNLFMTFSESFFTRPCLCSGEKKHIVISVDYEGFIIICITHNTMCYFRIKILCEMMLMCLVNVLINVRMFTDV